MKRCSGKIVLKWFLQMRKIGFDIKWVGYDRRYSREFVLKMKKSGFKMRDQSQRYVEKTEAFREIEKKLKKGEFYYLHNKAFEYCLSNVKAIEDSDEFVRFEKVQPTSELQRVSQSCSSHQKNGIWSSSALRCAAVTGIKPCEIQISVFLYLP